MAEMRGNSNNKKRLSIDLSIFANTIDYIYTMTKSPKNFEEPNGVVGLGIVAAMDIKAHEGPQDPIFSKAAILAVSPRSSSPIPILSQRNNFVKKSLSFEEMEMCEEYTCVISHVGNNLVKKREYFDGDFLGFSEGKKLAAADGATSDGGAANSYWMSSGVVSGSSAVAYGGTPCATEGWTADFLNSCFLCKKKLHGLDIFMYRGEKAFCSAECRYKQISVDEHKEKCGSGVIKPTEYSVSPCSGPMHCFAGVAAA